MKEVNNKKALFLIILVFFISHLLYLNTPFVNLEWVYKVGTQYYTTWDTDFLKVYLSEQANPITYSYFSSFIVHLLGDHYLSYRLLALIGGTLILLSMLRYESPFLLLIIALNPLVWIYSGRAYSELLSVGLLVLAIEMHRNGYYKGFLAGLSASIKYHSILFAGPYWFMNWVQSFYRNKRLNFKDIYLTSGLVCLISFVFFLFLNYNFYDIWIIPDKFRQPLGLRASNYLDNFFSYGFYLSAMFFVTIPFFLRNSSIRSNVIALLVSVPLALINQDNGEMNFGSLDQLLGSQLILLIKIIGFWNFLLCIEYFMKQSDLRLIVLTILTYILILSATRPAQRYLLFVIPFWALLIVQSNMKIAELFKWGYVSLLLFMVSFSSIYQVSNAYASKEIISWSEKNDLTINTNFIYAHVGDSRFHSWDSELSVQLSKKENQEVLFSSPVKIFGYEIRRYLVVKEVN